MTPSKQELIAAAQAMAARLGAPRYALTTFCRETGANAAQVYRTFGSWPALCEAAAIEPRWHGRVTDEAIFAAMRDVFLACHGIVTRAELTRRFPLGDAVFNRRFRTTWPRALAEFHAWATTHAPDFPYMDQVARRVARRRGRRTAPALTAGPARVGPPWPSLGTRPGGAPLQFRALLQAPVNELGVILAFGMVAVDLGYFVETVAAGFPDCTAKRLIGAGRYETVRIEFEYRSRNFHTHGHDPAACDVIVCWEDNWPDCPIEVLALKDVFARLSAAAAPGTPERVLLLSPSPSRG